MKNGGNRTGGRGGRNPAGEEERGGSATGISAHLMRAQMMTKIQFIILKGLLLN